MKIIVPSELSALLTAQPETVLIDVRTPAEYEAVHVPRARNIPLTELAPRALFGDGSLLADRPIYLLCQSGTRSILAGQKFRKDGFENVVIVEGGTVAWKDAGLPLERGEVAAMSLERQVRIAAGSLVLVGVVLSYLLHPWFIGLSAFVGAGLVFAGVTDWCGMGLLLARLPWNLRPAAR